MDKYQIRRTDRVFFVGTTGSGKTSLAKSLLWGQRRVIILDPKRKFTLPESWPIPFITTSSLDELGEIENGSTVIYRPSYEETVDKCDTFFQWIYDTEDLTVFVDEVQSITVGKIGRWYARCIQEGRERGIAVWSATQRPAAIPIIVISESEHYFVFRLTSVNDRKRMADYSGREELTEPIRTRDEYGFRYYDVRSGKVRYYKSANLGKVNQ